MSICHHSSLLFDCGIERKLEHCYLFQAVVQPDGLIASLHGPHGGSEDEQDVLERSGLNRWLDRILPEEFAVFGDQRYSYRTRVMTPLRLGCMPEPWQVEFNQLMSRVRVSCDW